MSNYNLTAAQLHRAAQLKEKIEALHAQLDAVLDGNALPDSVEASESESSKPARKKRKFSAAGLARLRAAQKARWAKIKAGKPAKAQKPEKAPGKKSSAGSLAAKARWAKVKAGQVATAA